MGQLGNKMSSAHNLEPSNFHDQALLQNAEKRKAVAEKRKSVRLKFSAEEALDSWVVPLTWYTGHPAEIDRFYDFVDQYQKDHGYSLNKAGLREIIEKKIDGDISDELREIIDQRLDMAAKFLAFLKRAKR